MCCISFSGFCQENCVNGKDDDGDGLTDLKDPDCQCRYTVTGNLLQNGSFEAFSHCPTYFYDNDYNMINNWRYGTYTNGNEAHYYHSFSCPMDSSLVMKYIPPALPLPDGRAFVSIRQSVYRKPGYKETDIAKTYISQCLSQPLQAGEQYTLGFSAGRFQSYDDPGFKYKTEPFTVAVFGHTDCNAVPFGQRTVNSNGCPANFPGWVLLGKTTLRSKGRWVQDKISFTAPAGIHTVAIGPDCSILDPDVEFTDSTTFSDFYVYYLDNVHLLRSKEFPFSYIRIQGGDPCISEPVLTAPAFADAAYQWYRDSVAITGATQETYQVPHNTSGFYNVRVSTADTCFVSEPLFAGSHQLSGLHVPADTTFCKGETLVLTPSVANVTYSWNGNTGSVVQIREPGVYEINAMETNGCSKAFRIRVQEQDCSGSDFYMPNAFTPNGDGKNDVFRIPQGSMIMLEEFSVYNRWGKKIFSTKNKSTGWNGTSGEKRSPEGSYVYLIKGTINNKAVIKRGTVILIR